MGNPMDMHMKNAFRMAMKARSKMAKGGMVSVPRMGEMRDDIDGPEPMQGSGGVMHKMHMNGKLGPNRMETGYGMKHNFAQGGHVEPMDYEKSDHKWSPDFGGGYKNEGPALGKYEKFSHGGYVEPETDENRQDWKNFNLGEIDDHDEEYDEETPHFAKGGMAGCYSEGGEVDYGTSGDLDYSPEVSKDMQHEATDEDDDRVKFAKAFMMMRKLRGQG